MISFHNIFFICLIIPVLIIAQGKTDFQKYFTDQTLRIDYFHIGDEKSEEFTIDKIYRYGIWAGTFDNLIDNFNNGAYYIKIYDLASGTLIYSKGFDSYFKEYQTSDPAINGVKKTFHESAIIPNPKNKIRFAVEKRDRNTILHEIYSVEIDPNDISVLEKDFSDSSIKVIKSLYNGDPHTKVDIAIIGEGYTVAEEGKFKSDLERFTKVFVEQEPYKSYKDRFNIYGVLKPSQQSGVDEPRAGIYKNTALSATFNSLGSERYLLTEDNKDLHDIAANVPFDALYIMVNHNRYGGGGLYNFYCTFTADNQFSSYLFTHEFGHSFAGLADEYYTSDVAYNDFYPRGVEPVEPNITSLLDPKNVKWKDLLTPGTEVPTPWEKADFDSMDYAWQKIRRELNNKIAELKRNHAPETEIKTLENEYNQKDKEHSAEVTKYLASSKFAGKVGAFEGAGYAAKGLYRPMINCLMFTKEAPFCKVCEAAVIRMIKFYSE